MSKILVNYNYNKTKDKYTLLNTDVVFAELPVAVLESEQEIIEPLVVPINGVDTIVEKSVYTADNKKFKLALDENGNVIECEKGVDIWLPKDTDISKLAYVNNRLVLKEEEKVEGEKPKPVKKTTGGKK